MLRGQQEEFVYRYLWLLSVLTLSWDPILCFFKCWKHVYSQTTEFAVHVLLKVSLSMEFTSIELLLVYNLCDYPERRRISNQPSNPFFWFYAVLEVNAVQGLNASATDRPNTTINAHPQT